MTMLENTESLPPIESNEQNTEVFFGPFAPEMYPSYAHAQLQEQFGDPQKNAPERAARREFWRNYQLLKEYIVSGQRSDLPIVQRVYAFFTESQTPEGKLQYPYAQKQLTEKPVDGLGHHLQDAQEFATQLLLKNQGKEPRFSSLLTERQAHLLAEVVTPLHDILKFLGSKEAQIMPDHELLTAQLVREVFSGQVADLGSLGQQALTTEDAEFIASVIGDHENIQKEEGRSEFSTSPNAAERAKSVFFLIDTFGKAFDINENNEVQLNEVEFQKRFVDLFQRHFDRKIAKIFRPQWGVYVLQDLRKTLSTLEQQGLQFTQPAGVDATIQYIAQAMVDKITEVDNRESTARAMGQPTFLQSGDLPELTKVKYTITERFITRTTQESSMIDQDKMPSDFRNLEADNPVFDQEKLKSQVLNTDPRRDEGEVLSPVSQKLLEVKDSDDVTQIYDQLGIEGKYKYAIMLSGGANDTTEAGRAVLKILEKAIAKLAKDEQIAAFSGGTKSAIMESLGKANAQVKAEGGNLVTVGVPPADKVFTETYHQEKLQALPDDKKGEMYQAEPNHDIILPVVATDSTGGVREGKFGDETKTLVNLFHHAAEKGENSLVISSNGGGITMDELIGVVQKGHTVLLMDKSDRAAEAIAHLKKGTLDSLPADAPARTMIENFKKKLAAAGLTVEQVLPNFEVFDPLQEGSEDKLVATMREFLHKKPVAPTELSRAA